MQLIINKAEESVFDHYKRKLEANKKKVCFC